MVVIIDHLGVGDSAIVCAVAGALVVLLSVKGRPWGSQLLRCLDRKVV